jgi:S-adenosylmethionine:tRNA ribosyltransferase-isomerase
MRTADFDYHLPSRLIAQYPLASRDQSRLLVLDRATRGLVHSTGFRSLREFLRSGDLLVVNDSRVLPARLRGRKIESGGEVEVLLLEEISERDWWTLLRPGKRVRPGTRLRLGMNSGSSEGIEAVVVEKNTEGHCRLHFCGEKNIYNILEQSGEIPLPPYISRPLENSDKERYQTVYARAAGSVAAPTAGLHFTPELMLELKARGVELHEVSLHVGLGTFAPVKAAAVEEHVMHEERFVLSPATASAINAARAAGRRVVAVGTTTVRVLESVAAQNGGSLAACKGRTRIFIYPPYRFRVVDGLLTNFHLPQSTLLMLVSAFASPGETWGREWMLEAYQAAVRENYRFFSYGDAMLIL